MQSGVFGKEATDFKAYNQTGIRGFCHVIQMNHKRGQKRDLAQRRRDAEGEKYKDRLPWFLFAWIRCIRGPVFFTAGMAVCPFFVFLSASEARRESLGTM